MKSENGWTGMPALSSVGFNRANWMEGMPPDCEGMLIRATGLRSIGCSLQKCEIRVYALAERVFLDCGPFGSEPGFRFFKFFREREKGGSFLFSKACGSLYRRRFKEFENAPFAAYSIELRTYSKSGL